MDNLIFLSWYSVVFLLITLLLFFRLVFSTKFTIQGSFVNLTLLISVHSIFNNCKSISDTIIIKITINFIPCIKFNILRNTFRYNYNNKKLAVSFIPINVYSMVYI